MAKTERLLLDIQIKNMQALGRVNANIKKLERSSLTMGSAIKGALGAFAIIGGARLAGGLVNTIRKFEDLKATLVTIEGDAKKAGEAFDLIRKFTAGTTFQLDEVSNAFIIFRNAGLNPTAEMMTNIGNIAAGMGKRIDDVARAVFNATTGEFEMLKQLGIKVKTEGDKLTVNFRGTARTIKNDGKAIVDFLQEIGAIDFAGAIDARAKTLSGAFSNLKDAIDEVAVAIGEGGLKIQLTELAREMTKLLQENPKVVKGLGDLGDTVGGFFTWYLKQATITLGDMGRGIQFLIDKLAILSGKTDEHIIVQRNFNETFRRFFSDVTMMDQGLKKTNKTQEKAIQITKTHQMKLDEYNMSAKEQKVQQDRVTKAMEKSKQEAEQLAARFNVNVTALDLFISGYNALNDQAVDSITNVIMGTESLGDAIKNITQTALRSLISSFVQLFIVGPALKKIAEIMGWDMVNATVKQTQAEKELNSQLRKQIGLRLLLMILGGAADGGTVGYGNKKGKANGGAIGYRGARAMGGNVGTGGAYLVGERGPELFVPNTAGTVVSNEASGGRMGGATVNFNISTVDAVGFDTLLTSRRALITNIISDAMSRQGRRFA
jgi:hypothetical protein